MRSIELFSGAGGLALGIEAAGFDHVALIERDAHACSTLRTNRPAWNVIADDVCRIPFSGFGPVDLVAGGPPCQPFSMGGKARGHQDGRDMFPQAVRAVVELAPKAFLFENVRGLLRPAFQNYVEFIRLRLSYPEFPVSDNASWDANLRRLQRHHTEAESLPADLRYHVTLHSANAADFGVPQHRHRVFFVGFRTDLDAGWSFPHPTHSEDSLLRDKWVNGTYWMRHPQARRPTEASLPTRLRRRIEQLHAQPELLASPTAAWKTVRDAISDLPDPRTPHTLPNHQIQPGARSYPGHTGSPFDEPSKALKAGDHGVPGGENMVRYPNGRVRYLTVREAARIQTFPDEFAFHGSWTETMRQLGNAVPVRFAACVAASIADALCAHERCPPKSAAASMEALAHAPS
ncbi:DNA (cytosine-5-)-methyltransferase [soil metagenome]